MAINQVFHINKRRKNMLLPPSEAPRRSRRIAGMGVERQEVCPPYLKKKVMRALDMDVQLDREQFDQKVLEDYAQRFRHPLPSSHSRALAALFGWAHPDDDALGKLVECRV